MAFRLFVGIGFSEDFAVQVETWMKKLRKTADQKNIEVKWTPGHNFHVTLVFLGETPAEKTSAIERVMAEVALNHVGFALKIRHVGAFPGIEQARVLWLGVQKSQALLDLQSALEQGLGIAPEYEYTPHLTVGRLRNPKGSRDLLSPFQHADFGRQDVREIILYQSIQAGPFPIYKALARFPLQDAQL